MESVDEIQFPADISLVRSGKPELVDNETKTIESCYKQENCNVSQICQSKKRSEVLNRILPVKEWEKDGKLYCQRISNLPGTKLDLENLTAKLDMYLKQFNAREVGVCPIRQQLYFQYFSEIIRQVTVNCTLRGSMFIQVRDEIKKNYESYQKLYESRIAHGIRKLLLCEEKTTDLKVAREELRFENEQLEAELAETIVRTEQFEREMVEAMKAEKSHHAKKLDDLKRANQLFIVHIESIINPNNNPNSYSYFNMI